MDDTSQLIEAGVGNYVRPRKISEQLASNRIEGKRCEERFGYDSDAVHTNVTAANARGVLCGEVPGIQVPSRSGISDFSFIIAGNIALVGQHELR
jgi:hypothetical protein